jgi:hypothetical protein
MILWIDQDKQYDPDQLAKHVTTETKRPWEISLGVFVAGFMLILLLALTGVAYLVNLSIVALSH